MTTSGSLHLNVHGVAGAEFNRERAATLPLMDLPSHRAVLSPPTLNPAVARASCSSVSSLFYDQVRQGPQRVAVEAVGRSLSYLELATRVRQLAQVLTARGATNGSTIAILSENRSEYLEVLLASASIGVVVACQNWRLTEPELHHCLALVAPKLVFVSASFEAKLANSPWTSAALPFGDEYESCLARAQELFDTESSEASVAAAEDVHPEQPLLILYTSGTTGLPKGAVISHRAEIIRNLVMRAEFGLAPEDTFVAWTPLYHMGAVDPALGALMSGGKVYTLNGFDKPELLRILQREHLGWLLVMPGMIGTLADELERLEGEVKGVKVCGVMADLVPPHEIQRITRLLGAPYANTFGSTETGCPPCSSSLIPVGVAPTRLSKIKSPFCEVKLLAEDGREVGVGKAGELCMRGPTLFSGYYQADEVNNIEFRDGWFHMGDVFVRNVDGTLDFVDRVKYLIKSGGENIYPAELERVILQDPRVIDVAVVRAADKDWGEVPVAFVASRDDSLTALEVERQCRAQLAGYKRPKRVVFVAPDEFPRSASGKIQRHELEKRL